ncbi:hypothetical protein MTO96_035620 [Rhipicephalus appendiculatus]
MLHPAHCRYDIVKCNVTTNGFCIWHDNTTINDTYEVLRAPPNCSKWVCNVTARAFLVFGCPPDPTDRLRWLFYSDDDWFWPKCCNVTQVNSTRPLV